MIKYTWLFFKITVSPLKLTLLFMDSMLIHYGNVVLQKTYIKNYFAGNQVTNKGEYPKYEYKNHHEAIL